VNLVICDSNTITLPDSVRLPISALSMVMTQHLISANDWDIIHIQLSEHIPRHVLNNVRIHAARISISLPTVITEHILHLIIELFPHIEGQVRKMYHKGDDITCIVPTVLTQV
jgi:hypothetical protein